MAGELVYTGVRRTPLCAVAPAVPFQGTLCPLAAEWFATTLDIYLWRGDIPEDARDTETANGRPATRLAAYDRLARQLCCDRSEVDEPAATVIAEYLADRQREQISAALETVLRDREPRRTIILSGSGSFLGRQIAARHPRLDTAKIVKLAEEISGDIATAACAYALATMRAESSP
jgi:uncharacterized hydantoinase/oxoprolinase family protein